VLCVHVFIYKDGPKALLQKQKLELITMKQN